MSRPPGNDPLRFHCTFEGCQHSYQRKEHLHRHQATQHLGSLMSACHLCDRVFSRNDTLRRHIRRDHKDTEAPSTRALQACRACRMGKVRCRGGRPCDTCRAQDHDCIFDEGPPPPVEAGLSCPDGNPEPSTSSIGLGLDSASQIDRYVQLYFTEFHPHWPILHRGTFSVHHEPPLLVQAVLMIGLWVSGTSSAQRAALELHLKLGNSILAQKSKWQPPEQTSQHSPTTTDQEISASRWPIATYQGILLYLIFSCISPLTTTRSLDLSLTLPPSDRRILSALVAACLRNNIFYYPIMLTRYQDIDSVTCIWVGVEEIKRLGLALYKISRLCRGTTRAGADNDGPLLQLADLRFPPPDSSRLWEAESNPELARLLVEIDNDNGHTDNARFDGRLEANWVSSCGRLFACNDALGWL
ncbi:hypothetical protein BJX61DRAFT_539125 [Aspergillus egyptiacus]|nr:hypothetical protein BJX61DRAFT_539125 [Aspergillus egyptiacus]